ncbi:hypothetical protein Dda_0821 [Drechslerella dactyloides]|uniref:Cytochrome c oxidase assembly protein COX20, mitochondrial n=1 Tax=Drechslerella dactyloides TaxID=74499 RepID=A0AAD6J890_DREDA|nr:hypothetical protein Dda_0821 [Drechslerella dactyloides]
MANDTSSPSSSSPSGSNGSQQLPPLPDPSSVGQVPPRGRQGQDYSVGDAINHISTDSVTKIHQMPCFRQAYLTGIATGFGFGGVKMILKASVYNACTWAVGMFCFSSIVIWEACRWRRGREHDGMVRAMQLIEYKRLERERRLEEKKQEQVRLKQQEEEEVRRKEAEKRWWRW